MASPIYTTPVKLEPPLSLSSENTPLGILQKSLPYPLTSIPLPAQCRSLSTPQLAPSLPLPIWLQLLLKPFSSRAAHRPSSSLETFSGLKSLTSECPYSYQLPQHPIQPILNTQQKLCVLGTPPWSSVALLFVHPAYAQRIVSLERPAAEYLRQRFLLCRIAE